MDDAERKVVVQVSTEARRVVTVLADGLDIVENSTMAAASDLSALKALTEKLSPQELLEVIEHCTEKRRNKLSEPAHFPIFQDASKTSTTSGHGGNMNLSVSELASSSLLRLPVEMRAMIYELVVTPEVVKAHVTRNRIPAILKTSTRLRDEFAAFYYSRKVFQAQLLSPKTLSWEEVKDPEVLRAMFESWPGSYTWFRIEPVHELRSRIEQLVTVYKRRSRISDDLENNFKHGLIQWTGGSTHEGVMCMHCAESTPSLVQTRCKDLVAQWLCCN